MKRLFIFSTFLLLLLSTTFPQQSGNTIKPNLKYGKPSKEELSLNSYAPDTTATAIYLFRMGESKFVYKDGFQLVTEHWVRIKVLKPQGVSYADVTTLLLPFRQRQRAGKSQRNKRLFLPSGERTVHRNTAETGPYLRRTGKPAHPPAEILDPLRQSRQRH